MNGLKKLIQHRSYTNMTEAVVAGVPPPPQLTGYGEIAAAFQIVREIKQASLKWKPEIFNTILYEGTPLAREDPRFVGENEILRKNIYYLATLTKNVPDEFVLILVTGEVLTAEEGELIKQQRSDKLRAIKLYAFLVEKEDPNDTIATAVLAVLRDFHNDDVLKIFEDRNMIARPENAGDANLAQEDEAGRPAGDAEIAEEWSCRFCTFLNNAGTNICEVCAKTVDFNLDDSIDFHICPQCTLMNENGIDECEACGFRFLAFAPPPPDDTDSELEADE